MSEERQETVEDNVSVNHQFREVAKMIPHEEVAVSKMETTTPTSENSSQVGNAAAMREALGDVYNTLEQLHPYALNINDISRRRAFRSMLCHAKNVIDITLAAPPRNCDKYTLAESLRKYGFPTKSKPWGEKEWLDFCEWYISEAKGEVK